MVGKAAEKWVAQEQQAKGLMVEADIGQRDKWVAAAVAVQAQLVLLEVVAELAVLAALGFPTASVVLQFFMEAEAEVVVE